MIRNAKIQLPPLGNFKCNYCGSLFSNNTGNCTNCGKIGEPIVSEEQ